jgi:glucan phosphoethanolaminetransferase (alkaline phosphatase superfamily)
MPPHPVLHLLADLALWSVVPAAFLAAYTSGFGHPASAVAPHAIAVGVVWLAVATLRVGARLVLPARLARVAGTFVTGTTAWALALYYAAVLVGLASWGHVLTLELVAGYSGQVRGLADSMGVSLAAVTAGLAGSLVAAWALAWRVLGRIDWTVEFVARGSPAMVRIGSVSTAALVVLLVAQFQFASIAWTRAAEPFAMTVFPHYGTTMMQSYRVVNTPERASRDALEERERASLRPPVGVPRRNLVVIVVDALRSDHMGVYGYARETTPWLSARAREGRLRRVDGIRAVCAESACGLTALFTSRHMHEVPIRPLTLHQVMKANGYRVMAILGGNHSQFYGLGALYEGIDSVVDGGAGGLAGARARYLNDDRWVIDEAGALQDWDGTPTMLQFHLMSTHQLGTRATPERPWSPAKPYWAMVPNAIEPSVNWYDNGVHQTDEMIRRLLATLEAKGYLRDALVAVTSDHGESLGERGRFSHSSGVGEPLLNIPLLLLGYGGWTPPELRPRPVASQVDVAPTLLATLGLPVPSTWVGTALTEPARAARVWFHQGAEVGQIDLTDPAAPLKYWVDMRSGAEQAYDLATDPTESRNIAATLPPERLRAYRLDALRRTPG